ncbi:transmembrane 4 L6 family member 4-like [Perca flavescens]|uniref:transmembrane 4 L6 family member 4-like n=1 Tax=Perca flavescens TaxID=8167 RepID=UPI00106E9112|nr:transmembrane 4 L6 family member 4-like [Perca flavescens]
MCTGKCSRCIAITLYPLALICIICNIVLFFPGGDVKYAKAGHLTEEVSYMGGLVGGGVMVLIAAIYINMTEAQGCCGNRFGMFLSIAFAAVGVVGALYSFIVAVLGLNNGPFCKYNGAWITPFKNSNSTYLADHELWAKCTEPKNVVQFNMGLFLTLMATSCLQMLLCAIQMINGLFGCLFGVCINKENLQQP